jgi:hypothetical protein
MLHPVYVVFVHTKNFAAKRLALLFHIRKVRVQIRERRPAVVTKAFAMFTEFAEGIKLIFRSKDKQVNSDCRSELHTEQFTNFITSLRY